MGVIKNFDFGSTPPIFKTSEESLNSVGLSLPATPPSEIDEPPPPLERRNHFNPQRRDPQLLIQRLEQISRKRTGARKARREENARSLQTLAESDGEIVFSPTIDDFIPHSSSPLMKFMTDFNCMWIWQYFVAQNEEEQKAYLNNIDLKWSRKPEPVNGAILSGEETAEKHEDGDNDWTRGVAKSCNLSPDERFSLIDWSLRSILKKKQMPLGVLSSVEMDVVSAFRKDASAVYTSTELNGFEGLLLQAVCQYHLLKSWSVDGGRRGRAAVATGGRPPLFRAPKLSLVQFLERRRRLLARS